MQESGSKRIPRSRASHKFRSWQLHPALRQALARDIFSDMMVRVEEAGYECVMHVHDELIVEVDADKAELALEEIVGIMSTPPEWIPEIPLAAEGKIMTEYAK
jgi:DNA polymerase